MRLFLALGLWLCFAMSIQAQEIKVLESESRQPIVGVTIFNESKSIFVITDFDGLASLNSFSDSENIYFEDIFYSKLKF